MNKSKRKILTILDDHVYLSSDDIQKESGIWKILVYYYLADLKNEGLITYFHPGENKIYQITKRGFKVICPCENITIVIKKGEVIATCDRCNKIDRNIEEAISIVDLQLGPYSTIGNGLFTPLFSDKKCVVVNKDLGV